jgi:ComF family protein
MGGVWDVLGRRGRRCDRSARQSFWTKPVQIIEFIVQAVIDFLIDDVCALCGRTGPTTPEDQRAPPPVRSDSDTTGVDVDRLADSLRQPTRHRYLGRLSITNHPVCDACARGVEPAQRRGVLGTVPEPGCVVTVSGASFAGCRPSDASLPGPLHGGGVAQREIGVIAPFMTDDNILKLVHLVKFSRQAELTVPMGVAMAEARRVFGRASDEDVIVPVPMRASERRQRGFNQAHRLAEVLGDHLGSPVIDDALEKTLPTAPQSKTPSGRRAENVRGAFRCRCPDALCGRPVLLVDDLVTTGATAGACAAELLAAGAGSVHVVCFARAL